MPIPADFSSQTWHIKNTLGLEPSMLPESHTSLFAAVKTLLMFDRRSHKSMETTSRPGPDTSGTHGFDGFIEKVSLSHSNVVNSDAKKCFEITTDTLGSLVSLGVLTLCILPLPFCSCQTSYEQPTARQRGVGFSHAAPRLGDQL